jgi:hypothetical protein
MSHRSANPDRDRTVSEIHEIWRKSNPRKKTETENEYIVRQQKIIYGIDLSLRKKKSEKDIKAELGLGSGKKSKRRKTRSRKTRRYRK